MKKYNFKLFVSPRGMGKYKGGLTVSNHQVVIHEKDFLPNSKTIDVYTDSENEVIKVVDGSSYSYSKTKNGLRGHRRNFGSRALLKSNCVKIGHYEYIGDNIFKFDPN